MLTQACNKAMWLKTFINDVESHIDAAESHFADVVELYESMLKLTTGLLLEHGDAAWFADSYEKGDLTTLTVAQRLLEQLRELSEQIRVVNESMNAQAILVRHIARERKSARREGGA